MLLGNNEYLDSQYSDSKIKGYCILIGLFEKRAKRKKNRFYGVSASFPIVFYVVCVTVSSSHLESFDSMRMCVCGTTLSRLISIVRLFSVFYFFSDAIFIHCSFRRRILNVSFRHKVPGGIFLIPAYYHMSRTIDGIAHDDGNGQIVSHTHIENR